MYDDLLLLQPAAAAAGTVVNPLTGLGGAAAQPLQQHMKHLGDFDGSTVIYGKFTTYRPSTGAAFTLGGTPALSVYKDNSTTQSTSGVTLTADFDGVAGFNHFAIDTSADGTFYSAGSNFDIVITAGTVDSVSVVGSVVASFTIRKDSALKPTTAGRSLDVSAGGEAGVDWANIGSPTTTVNLSGTTVKTATDVETDTADIQSRLPAALVSGRIDASVGAMAANTVTASALAADAVTEIQSGLATSAALSTVEGKVDVIDATADAILVDTAEIGVAGAGLTALASAANLAAVAGYVDTEVQAIKTVTDRLGTMIENTSDGWIWTIASLQQVPSGGLDAAGVRAAIGLDSANLDTQLDALPTAAENAAAVMGSTIEGSFDLTESARLWNAALAGKASGLATATATFRDLADGKDRIVATVDADGNRTAVTRDVT